MGVMAQPGNVTSKRAVSFVRLRIAIAASNRKSVRMSDITPKIGDVYVLTLNIADEDDGMYTGYIPEINHTVYLSETELEELEKQ